MTDRQTAFQFDTLHCCDETISKLLNKIMKQICYKNSFVQSTAMFIKLTRLDDTIERPYFHFYMWESMPLPIKEYVMLVVISMIEMHIRTTLVPPATSINAMLTSSCTIPS